MSSPNASETSPLVPSNSDVESDVASEDTIQSQCLWEELEKPWPSTYERSIALLSSPVIQTAKVELFTRSPKPGSTPQALSRRRNLDRGFYTPESGGVLPPRFRQNLSDRDGFRNELEKVKSLDFQAGRGKKPIMPEQLRKAQQEQQRKNLEAKKYRAKILAQKDEEAGDSLMSPGYGREVASRRAKQKADEVEAMLHDGKSSVAQCIFNLANILMGVGLLGLPFAMKSAGWYGGMLSLVVFGFITWRTSILIGRELNGDPRPTSAFDDSPYKSPIVPGSSPHARMLPPISSFPDIARASFGEVGCIVLSSVLYFELFSCICIFFVTMGDHLHQLFPSIPASKHVLMVGALSMIPTIMLHTPALLSYLSMVGTFATIAVILSVIFSAVTEGDIAEKVTEDLSLDIEAPYHIYWNPSGLAVSLGLVAYCFSGHAIVPSIYTSMRNPQKFESMVTYTFLFVIVACICVGASGYYMFGATVLDQVTLSLERSSKAGAAMKALTWLMIMTGTQMTERYLGV